LTLQVVQPVQQQRYLQPENKSNATLQGSMEYEKKNSIIRLSNYSCYSHSYYKAQETIQNKGDCLE